MLSPCSIMQLLYVGHQCYWPEGYLSAGTHVIMRVWPSMFSFQNQYSHSHTNFMLCPLDKRWVKEMVGIQSYAPEQLCKLSLLWKPAISSSGQLRYITSINPDAYIVHVKFRLSVLKHHSPSGRNSLLNRGWQLLIMVSGTDYNPTWFLLAHIHVTLLMNYKAHKGSLNGGHSVSIYMLCNSLREYHRDKAFTVVVKFWWFWL